MSSCKGCGRSLPPNSGPGRPRVWCSERCRKQTLYGGTCVDCGARLNGSDSRGRHIRCVGCAADAKRIWNREAIILAIREWADAYGEPPTATQWNPAQARRNGNVAVVERFYAAHWPQQSTVAAVFGSWNVAIEAAGFTPRPAWRPSMEKTAA